MTVIHNEAVAYVSSEELFGIGRIFPPNRTNPQVKAFENRRMLYDRGYFRNEQDLKEQVRSNYYKRVTNFWSQTLYAIPPTINSEDGAINEFVQAFQETVLSAMQLVANGASIEGVGIAYLSRPGNVGFVNARHWFPVVAPDDESDIRTHVIAYPYLSGESDDNNVPDRIKLIFIRRGQKEIRDHKLEGNTIGELLAQSVQAVPDVSVIPTVHTAAESHYGVSDYPDLLELIRELNRRLTKNSSVITRHADPHLAVPAGALAEDTDGQTRLEAPDFTKSKVLPVQDGEATPAYVVWDAKLEGSFSQIERVLDQFFVISSISPSLFGAEKVMGRSSSGLALRRMALPTVQRLLFIRRQHEATMRQIYASLAQGLRQADIAAPEIQPNDLIFTWPDVLKEGDKEVLEAETLKLDAGLTSREDALARVEDIPLAQARERISQLPGPTSTE